MAKIISEPFWPRAEHVTFIDEVTRDTGISRGDYGEWAKQYAVNHKRRLAHDLLIVEDFLAKGARTLEIGTSPMVMTVALKKRGYDIQGVDIDPSRFSQIMKDFCIDVTRCDVEMENLPFDDREFDAVIFNEMFEHLRINPIFTLSQIKRILKPQGVFIMSTPNLRSIDGVVNFLLHNQCFSCSGDIFKQYSKLEMLGHMGHVREYTTVEVEKFLTEIGFCVESLVFRGRYNKNWKQILARAWPNMRPFVTYVARA